MEDQTENEERGATPEMVAQYELVGDCGHRYDANGDEGDGIALCYKCKGAERYFKVGKKMDTKQTETKKGATPELANEQEETALANVKLRMEDIKVLLLLLEEQHLTKKQRNAVQRIRTDVEVLINDMMRGYIDVQWGRITLRLMK